MTRRFDPSRRGFLRASAAAGLAGLGCRGDDPYALEKPPVPGAERWRRFEEKTISTACAQCPAGCGVHVRVVEGRAVKIEGQPDNPINRGGIGPRGLAGLQVLYDPDRIRQPLRRTGPRGSGSFEPVSWESALQELSGRLRGLREQGEARRLAIVSNRERGVMQELWQRFAESYGTPNFFDGSARANGAVARALELMQGVPELPAHDWGGARYILSLGAGALEASCQTIYFARAAAELKRGAGRPRGKIVDVEDSYSRTAASSDEWIQIAPASYGAFALGIAHVLVAENLYDRRFVEEHGSGFEDWTDEDGVAHRGFRNVLLSDYAPEQVALTCQIEPDTLVRIAREMTAEGPGFAFIHSRTTRTPNGLHTAMCVHALNALLGAIDRPGGVLTQRAAPLAPWPPIELDASARTSLQADRLDGVVSVARPLARSVLGDLPESLLAGRPYPVDTLLLYYANPCYAWSTPESWRGALEKVPFIVDFTPFMDETAAEVADLVLPDHTYLERWEDSAPAPGAGVAVFGLRQPVVEPLHDTRASGDVVIELARGLGDTIAAAFPWRNFRSALLDRVIGLHEAQRGSIVEKSPKRFLARLLDEGFWSDAEYPFESWGEVLRTPSKGFEFFSLRLWEHCRRLSERSGRGVAELLERWGHDGDLELVCMPYHRDLAWAGDAEKYPLLLQPYTPATYAEGSGANLPLLQGLVTEPGSVPWDTTAAMHPQTAEPLGVRDGDRVLVESPAGKAEFRLHLHWGVWPGVLRVPRGGGHTAFGRFAQGRGGNVMTLLQPRVDRLAGFEALQGTRVRVERIQS